jgi:uncharacterized protein (DUF302 family)
MAMQAQVALGLTAILQTNFETALERVAAALKTEGFGILTEIDVKETFKKKLDVEFRPYKILGACNPQLAYRSLSAAPEAGLLLPCNVTVSQGDDGTVLVSIVDPLTMMSVLPDGALRPVAQEARDRLERVIGLLKI